MSNGITIQQVKDVIEDMKANNAPEEQINSFLATAKPKLTPTGFSTMLQPNPGRPSLGQFTQTITPGQPTAPKTQIVTDHDRKYDYKFENGKYYSKLKDSEDWAEKTTETGILTVASVFPNHLDPETQKKVREYVSESYKARHAPTTTEPTTTKASSADTFLPAGWYVNEEGTKYERGAKGKWFIDIGGGKKEEVEGDINTAALTPFKPFAWDDLDSTQRKALNLLPEDQKQAEFAKIKKKMQHPSSDWYQKKYQADLKLKEELSEEILTPDPDFLELTDVQVNDLSKEDKATYEQEKKEYDKAISQQKERLLKSYQKPVEEGGFFESLTVDDVEMNERNFMKSFQPGGKNQFFSEMGFTVGEEHGGVFGWDKWGDYVVIKAPGKEGKEYKLELQQGKDNSKAIAEANAWMQANIDADLLHKNIGHAEAVLHSMTLSKEERVDISNKNHAKASEYIASITAGIDTDYEDLSILEKKNLQARQVVGKEYATYREQLWHENNNNDSAYQEWYKQNVDAEGPPPFDFSLFQKQEGVFTSETTDTSTGIGGVYTGITGLTDTTYINARDEIAKKRAFKELEINADPKSKEYKEFWSDPTEEQLAKIAEISSNMDPNDPALIQHIADNWSKEDIEIDLDKKIRSYVQNNLDAGFFVKSMGHRWMNVAAEGELEVLSEKNKEHTQKVNVTVGMLDSTMQEIDSIVRWSAGIEDEVERITKQVDSGEITAAEGQRLLNEMYQAGNTKKARYEQLQEQKEVLWNNYRKYEQEAENLNIREEELSTFVDTTNRNHGLGTVTAATVTNATMSLGIGLFELNRRMNPLLQTLVAMGQDGEDRGPVGDTLVNMLNFNQDTRLGDLVSNTLGVAAIKYDDFYKKQRNGIIQFQQDYLQNTIEKPLEYGDIGNVTDFVHYYTTGMANFLPQMALMATLGPAAAVVMAASSSGNKFVEMEQTMDLYGVEYTPLQMYASAAIAGVSEYIFERFTYSQFKRMNGLAEETKEKAFRGAGNWFMRNVFNTKSVLAYAYDHVEEGGTEALTQLTNNWLVDRVILGKEDVGIWDGVHESFMQGVVISNGMKINGFGKAMLKPFQSADNQGILNENADRMAEISKIISDPKTSKEVRDGLIKEKLELIEESNQILSKDIKKVDILTTTEKKALVTVDKRNGEFNKQIENIKNDPNITDKQKQREIEVLQNKINKNNGRKETILTKYNDALVEANYQKMMENTRKLAEEAELDVNIEEMTAEEIAEALLADQAKTRAEIEEIENRLKQIDPKSEEAIMGREMLEGYKNHLAGLESADKQFGYHVAPKYDAEGNLVEPARIVVNKTSSLAKGRWTTGAHEFLHTVLHQTLKGDQNLQFAVGNALQEHANIQGVSPEFAKRMQVYEGDKNYGEEIITVMSESMLDGTLEFNENLFTRIGDNIRRSLQNKYPDTLGKIEFNSGKDVYNFIKDYNKTVQDPTKLTKAMKVAMKKGAGGKLVDNAITKRNEQIVTQYSKEEASDRVQEIYEKEGIAGTMSIIEQFAPIVDGLVKSRDQAPGYEYQLLKDEIETGKRGIMDLIQEYNPLSAKYSYVNEAGLDGEVDVMVNNKGEVSINKEKIRKLQGADPNAIKDYITENFGRITKKSQIPLAAYINKFLPVRAIEASKRVLKEGFTVSEEGGREVPAPDTDADSKSDDLEGSTVTAAMLGIESAINKAVKSVLDGASKIITYKKLKGENKYTQQELEVTKENLDPDSPKYKGYTASTLPNMVAQVIADKIGVPVKKILDPSANITPAELGKIQFYINKHLSSIASGLLDGSTTDRKGTMKIKTGLLRLKNKNGEPILYEKKGKLYVKKKNINLSDLKDALGITQDGVKGKPVRPTKGTEQQLAGSILFELGRMMTNQSVRQQLPGLKSIPLIRDGVPAMQFARNSDQLGTETKIDIHSESIFPHKELQQIYDEASTRLKDVATVYGIESPQFQQVAMGMSEDALSLGMTKIAVEVDDFSGTKGFKTTLINSEFTPEGFTPKENPGKDPVYQKKIANATVKLMNSIHPDIIKIHGGKPGQLGFLHNIFGWKDKHNTFGVKEFPTQHKNSQKTNQWTEAKIKAELQWMKENDIDIEKIKKAQPNMNKGRVSDILYDIFSQPTRELQEQKLKEHQAEIKEINEGNQELLKLIEAKERQAYKNIEEVDADYVYAVHQVQTNITAGRRAYSTIENLLLADGPIVGIKNPPARTKQVKGQTVDITDTPKYQKAKKEYIDSWKNTVFWDQVYNEVKSGKNPKYKEALKKRMKNNPNLTKQQHIENLVISEVQLKNEHIGASANTMNKSADGVFSDGKSEKKNGKTNRLHKSLWGPKFIMDNYLDPRGGKVNIEGSRRITRYLPEWVNNIVKAENGENILETVIRDEKVDRLNIIDDVTLQNNETISDGMQMSRDPDTPQKGISVLDFDDTLATSKSKVIVVAPDGTKSYMNAAQWAKGASQLLKEGHKFDFSEFKKVIDGKPAPLLNKAKKLAKKFGTKDMFILTARPAESAKAIHEFLKANGLNIPIENITGLGDSTAKAKAMWVAEKISKGYNDFYFADDSVKNVKAVDNMLQQHDVKSKVQQARLQFSKDPDVEFNQILEDTKDVGRNKKYSGAQAKQRGKDIGKWNIFLPPAAEDFKGLLYSFLAPGKKGEQQLQWFKDILIRPFSRAMQELDILRNTMASDYKTLRKQFPQFKKKLNKKVPGTNFTWDQAVRVYLWDKAGFKIPDLSAKDKTALIKAIKADPDAVLYSEVLSKISKQKEGWTKPGEYWLTETISSDIDNIINNVNRPELLQEFIANRKKIFGEWKNGKLVGPNINKIEAIYGTRFKEALENMLWRMEKGTNRTFGSDRTTNRFINWVNGSIGAIMFFNQRSAVLQLISSVNFINWNDNNPVAAAKAFANQKQFWGDFVKLWNSPFLTARRAGLRGNIEMAEIAAAAKQGGPKAVFSYMLKLGFTPTQIADSFAIAFGGSSMWRNRVNTYLKEGMSQKEAEAKATQDWIELSNEAQQSSRADFISMQQAGPLGRVILAFQNTPMQYMRLTKKSILDLVNGRGDTKTNISKIIYYTAVQNAIFGALQSALFRFAFEDEEEDEEKNKKQLRVANGMMDSVLRGMGIGGAVVSTAKNMIMKFIEQENKANFDESAVVLEFLNLSPPIGSKARKIVSAMKTLRYQRDEIEHMEKLNVNNPIWQVIGNITSGTTNIPLDRVINKLINIKEALDSDNEVWQRLSLINGWNTWDLGVKPDDLQKAREEVDIIKSEKKKAKKESDKKRKEKERLEKLRQGKFDYLSDEEFDVIKQAEKLTKLNKSEQVNMLMDLGLSTKEIKELRYEEDRVLKIIELQAKAKK